MGVIAQGGGMSESAVVPSEHVFKLPEGSDCDVGGESV